MWAPARSRSPWLTRKWFGPGNDESDVTCRPAPIGASCKLSKALKQYCIDLQQRGVRGRLPGAIGCVFVRVCVTVYVERA